MIRVSGRGGRLFIRRFVELGSGCVMGIFPAKIWLDAVGLGRPVSGWTV